MIEMIQSFNYGQFWDLPCPCGCGLALWICLSRNAIRRQSGAFKLSKDLSTPENREFWLVGEKARKIVSKWPAWKRGVTVLAN